MADRKMRRTLAAAAWIGTLLWSLALLSTATAVASHARAVAAGQAEARVQP